MGIVFTEEREGCVGERWRGNWDGLVGRREHGVLKWILTRSRNIPYFTITTTVIPFENSFSCVLERSDCSCALFSFPRLLEGKYGFYDCPLPSFYINVFVLYKLFIRIKLFQLSLLIAASVNFNRL